MATTPVKAWTKLLGSSLGQSYALTTGLDGSIYVGGSAGGALDGNDVSLTKYSTDGTKAWTKLLGTSGIDIAWALTTGLDGSIYVSGQTTGALDGQTNSGGYSDAFLTKYSADGTKAWTKLLGSSGEDGAYALTTGLDGSIFLGGRTTGALDGQASSGGYDVFLSKYSADGTKAWTKLLGASGDDYARALTTGLDGSIYVSGYTDGALDGQTNSGQTDAFLTKYSTGGTKAWTRLLGSSAEDVALAPTIGPKGSIPVARMTSGALDGQTFSGQGDVFLTNVQGVGAITYSLSAESSNYNDGSTASFTLIATNFTPGLALGSTI